MAKKDPRPAEERRADLDTHIAMLRAMRDEGRLTRSAHDLQVRNAERAFDRGHLLPDPPRHDSPKWMVNGERGNDERRLVRSMSVSKKAAREREEAVARAAAVERWRHQRAATFDLALAEGRMNTEQHAAALERLKTQAPPPPMPVPKRKGRLSVFLDAVDTWN